MPPRKKKGAATNNGTEETQEKLPDLQWSDKMERALFEGFLDAQNAGKRADTGWKSEAWGPVIEAVQARYTGPVTITRTHCQTKESGFKAHYRDHLWLENKSGFTYLDSPVRIAFLLSGKVRIACWRTCITASSIRSSSSAS